MVMTSSGTDRTALTQKRRVKSTSSGLGPSSPVGTPIGSSAMPQIGQEPGLSRTISGMHRAGVLRALRHRLRRAAGRRDIAVGVGLELLLAAGRAEIEALALVAGKMLGRRAVDAHAADRIGGLEIGSPAPSRTWPGSGAAEMEDMAGMFSGRLPGAGSTVMPQTGSRNTVSAAVSAGWLAPRCSAWPLCPGPLPC